MQLWSGRRNCQTGTYAERIRKTRNIRPMWQGVQALTRYKAVIVSKQIPRGPWSGSAHGKQQVQIKSQDVCSGTALACVLMSALVSLTSLSQATVAKKPVVSCLSGYRPVALTPIVMKYFELLIKPHITASLPASFDQFACCPNRSIEDASLHPILGNSTKPSG